MASVYLSDAHGLKPFDCSETAGISARWKRWGAIHSTKISGNFGPKLNGSVRSNRKRFEKTGPPFEVDHFSRSDRLVFWLNGSRLWLRAFELFATGKGVKNVDQKKALLLHTAGLNVQDIYFTLTEEGGSDGYQKAKATLNKYFKPQANVPYEKLCFREKGQLANETVEQFVTRLRQKAQTCEFGDAATVNEQIRDQVTSNCLSHEPRRKLLHKGRNLTPQLREIARSMEESEKQAR